MPLPPEYAGTVFVLKNPPDPLPDPFAIITGYHPFDRKTSDALNRQADEALRTRLESRGWQHFRATGGAADGSHREPGWAVVLRKSEAVALGRVFRQTAIWWIERDRLSALPCDGAPEEPHGRFSRRIRAGFPGTRTPRTD